MAVATKTRTIPASGSTKRTNVADRAKLATVTKLAGKKTDNAVDLRTLHPYAYKYARFLSGEIKGQPTPKPYNITKAKAAALRAEVKAIVPDTRKKGPRRKKRKSPTLRGAGIPKATPQRKIADAPGGTFSQADVAVLKESLACLIREREAALKEAVALGRKLGIA